MDLPAGHDDQTTCSNPHINSSRSADASFWLSQSPEVNPSEKPEQENVGEFVLRSALSYLGVFFFSFPSNFIKDYRRGLFTVTLPGKLYEGVMMMIM